MSTPIRTKSRHLYATKEYHDAFAVLLTCWQRADAARMANEPGGCDPNSRDAHPTAHLRFATSHGETHLIRAAVEYWVSNYLAPLCESLGVPPPPVLPPN